MRGYLTQLGGYLYFAEINRQPQLDSFIIQGKVKSVYYYTFNEDSTELWMSYNPFPRKRKTDRYSRPIRLSNNPKLGLPNFTADQFLEAIKYVEKPNEILEI